MSPTESLKPTAMTTSFAHAPVPNKFTSTQMAIAKKMCFVYAALALAGFPAARYFIDHGYSWQYPYFSIVLGVDGAVCFCRSYEHWSSLTTEDVKKAMKDHPPLRTADSAADFFNVAAIALWALITFDVFHVLCAVRDELKNGATG